MRRVLLLAGLVELLAVTLAAAQPPLAVPVPVTLCQRSHRVSEQLETVWQADLEGYQGHSRASLPPGLYRVLVTGPAGPGQGYKVLVGDGVPGLWQRHGTAWEALAVCATQAGPLYLWQDNSLPLRAVNVRCQPNLAAGAPYRLDPRPNFRRGGPGTCCDPRDLVQLTDGRLRDPWPTDPYSVGWEATRQVTVTLDLGDLYELSRVYVNMAGGGRDNVHFPAAITVEGALGNTLGATAASASQPFFLLGQWLNPKLPEPGDKQVQHQPITLHGRARYVRVTFYTALSLSLFMDEIEVY